MPSKIFSILSNQGTAMGEICLTEKEYNTPKIRKMVEKQARLIDDCSKPIQWAEVTDNEAFWPKDIDGVPYPDDMPYYQPSGETVLRDRTGKEWPSFAVWKNKDTCANLFPDRKPQAYYGSDIEEPMFVEE